MIRARRWIKIMGAFKIANGGNIYDSKRVEEKDMIDVARKLPKLL